MNTCVRRADVNGRVWHREWWTQVFNDGERVVFKNQTGTVMFDGTVSLHQALIAKGIHLEVNMP